MEAALSFGGAGRRGMGWRPVKAARALCGFLYSKKPRFIRRGKGFALDFYAIVRATRIMSENAV